MEDELSKIMKNVAEQNVDLETVDNKISMLNDRIDNIYSDLINPMHTILLHIEANKVYFESLPSKEKTFLQKVLNSIMRGKYN